MQKAQFFKAPDGSEFAILPRGDYEALLAAERRRDEKNRSEIPPEIVSAIAQGDNPVKALRGLRGFSQQQLADRVNLSKSYLSRIENGWLAPGNKTRRRLAEALSVPEGVLVGR